MDDCVDFILIEYSVHGPAVTDIVFIELYGFAGYFFNSWKGFFAGIVQIVHHDNIVSRLL